MTEENKHIAIHNSGPTRLTQGEDGRLVVSSADPVRIDLGQIKSVGIANIVSVENHAVHSIVGSVSHHVKFHGGGELRFAFNERGQLLEFTAHELLVTTQSGSVMVDVRPPAELAPDA